MKQTIKNVCSSLMFFLLVTFASAQARAPLPLAEDVVAKMRESDAHRQSELTGYTATRRYVAVNKKRRAEMLVRVSCDGNGAKQFSVVSEQGSGAIRKRVFEKLLSEETEASRRGTRNSTRLTPANYDFRIVGQETLETGPAYVLDVHFVHTYQKVGQFWFASSTDTTSQIRIFGDSELTIDNVDYKLNPPNQSNTTSSELDSEARLAQ